MRLAETDKTWGQCRLPASLYCRHYKNGRAQCKIAAPEWKTALANGDGIPP
ncbi:hypothetical protein GCM10023078_46550 [Gibbsiella greigii]